jgi:hypothetical protein
MLSFANFMNALNANFNEAAVELAILYQLPVICHSGGNRIKLALLLASPGPAPDLPTEQHAWPAGRLTCHLAAQHVLMQDLL